MIFINFQHIVNSIELSNKNEEYEYEGEKSGEPP